MQKLQSRDIVGRPPMVDEQPIAKLRHTQRKEKSHAAK